MTRTRKKNAIRAGCALPPREAAARRTNVTSDVKAATVQSILFKFSTLFSDPWHEGYPVKTATNEQYVLQTVRNSTPFAVDLIRFQRNEGQRKAVGALIQSFQFPSSAHNLSVILFRETRTVEIVQEPKPSSGDVRFCHWAITLTQAGMDYTKHFWVTLLESLRNLDAEALLYVNIERPIAVAPSNFMTLRNDELLAQVSNNEKSVSYHIKGEQHPWVFSGYVAKDIFQRQLGHVTGQTHELLLVGADYTASQKLTKKKRKEAAAERAVVALAQKKAKKGRKDMRRRANKKERIHRDAAYHPGVPN